MDAILFNSAIQKVLELGQIHLSDFGFTLDQKPEPQEDSGDWVASESIHIIYSHGVLPVQLRFFLCCGKGAIADSISAGLISRHYPHIAVNLSDLSKKQGLKLHTLDFNSPKKPMDSFLESYFSELGRNFEDWLNAGLRELQAREQTADQLTDFSFFLS